MEPFDVNKTVEILEPELGNDRGGGGLFLPKDRPEYIAPATEKSVLGLDVRAKEKQGHSKIDDGFKVPKEKITSIAASLDVDEGFESSEERKSNITNDCRSHNSRRYRNKTACMTVNAESTVTVDKGGNDDKLGTPRSREHRSSDVRASPSRSSRTVSSKSPRYERDDHGLERRGFSNDSRSDNGNARKRHYYDDRRDTHGRYGEDYRRSRSRYES